MTIASVRPVSEPVCPDVNQDFAGARAALTAWFVDEAWRLTNPRRLVREVCHRLVGAGVPLDRFNAYVFTLHPNYFGVRHAWDRASDEVRTQQGEQALLRQDNVRRSPIRVIREGAAGLRRRLDMPGVADDFPVLAEFRAEGATDYVLMRLDFSNGEKHCMSMITNRPGGFTTAELCLVRDLLPYMARLTEIQAFRYLATTLLDTYVGHDAGERILTGNITRGSVESIHAVVWLSDLRGFAALSGELPARELISLLNDYFDCVVGPVRRRQGEILKYVGDAVLAVFRVGPGSEVRAACDAAMAAAVEARTTLAETNARRAEAGGPAIDFGIALHLGDVLYGNVGAADRLDFTVIGPAVNLAARLEALCAALGEPVVVSAEFAAAWDGPAESLGEHRLKGIGAPVLAYRPDLDAARRGEAGGA